MNRILALHLLLIVSLFLTINLSCSQGGNILIVGSISGPIKVPEGTTVEFRVDAEGDSGITCFWVVNPVGFGILSNPNSKSTTFTAPEVDADFEIVIRVVVNSDRDGPVIRSTNVTIVDIGEPNDGDNGDDDDPPPINHPPTAAAHVSTVEVEVGVEIQFFDDSTDPDGNDDIVLWEWDFSYDPDIGFQVESEEQEPVHVYDEEGAYSIQLRVIDSGGISDMLDGPIEITVHDIIVFNPEIVTRLGYEFDPTDIEALGNYVYLLSPDFGFTVIDFTDFTQPLMVTTLGLEHKPKRLSIVGSTAYVISEEDATLQIINIGNPETPSLVNTIHIGGTGQDVAAQDGFAYAAIMNSGVFVIDVDPPEDANLIQKVDLPGECTAIDVEDGYAVVVNNNSQDLDILNISPPESSYLVNTIDSIQSSYLVELNQGYAFVCSRFYLRVFDITPPGSAHLVQEALAAHGLIVDFDVVGESVIVGSRGFQFFNFDYESQELNNISFQTYGNPSESCFSVLENIIFVANDEALRIGRIDQIAGWDFPINMHEFTETRDLAVNNNYLFAAAGDLLKYDMTLPGLPEQILNYTGLDYHRIIVEGNYAYVLGRIPYYYLLIYDVSPINKLTGIGSIEIRDSALNGDFDIENGYVYIANKKPWNSSGWLEIIDVDPPESMEKVIDIDFPGIPIDIEVQEGYAYIAAYDTFNGTVYSIDVDPPEDTHIINYYPTAFPARGISVQDDLVYVTSNKGSASCFEIFRITSPGELEKINQVSTDGQAERILVRDSYAYIANQLGLQVFDVRYPLNVSSVVSMQIPGTCIDLALDEPYIYLADSTNGVHIIKLW